MLSSHYRSKLVGNPVFFLRQQNITWRKVEWEAGPRLIGKTSVGIGIGRYTASLQPSSATQCLNLRFWRACVI